MATNSYQGGAPALLLAHKWNGKSDLTGWWMSEKLDGVRAYWTGSQFVSRLGNTYHAPAWFTKSLPKYPLDGELWVGRKLFQKTVSVVRRANAGDEWKNVRYLVFDAPAADGAFEKRIDALRKLFKRPKKYAEMVDQIALPANASVEAELARVEALGAEGLMFRQPGSLYIAGRSRSLLKVKSFSDAEAKVTGYLPGKGKHRGRVGALQVVTPTGIQFQVGTGLTDKQREDPPEVGGVITYRYQELTNAGVPRFPTFVGVRHDFTWPGTSAAKASPAATKSAPTNTRAAKTTAKKSSPKASATPKRTSKPAGTSTSARTQYFECKTGSGGKFWEVTAHGSAVAVRYGKLGTRGQTRLKVLDDADAATQEVARLVAAKQRKGYTVA
ncbi:MAG: DNA ligase [Nannocystaceae bacterium]